MQYPKSIQMSIIFLFCCLPVFMAAQCPSAQAGYLSGQEQSIGLYDTSSTPVFTINPNGLPNTEYIFIHANSMADDGMGPAMIDTDTIGVFTPAQFGLSYCDKIEVIPFSKRGNSLSFLSIVAFGKTDLIFSKSSFLTGSKDKYLIFNPFNFDSSSLMSRKILSSDINSVKLSSSEISSGSSTT